MTQFKPMLAAEADMAKLRYPLFASPKLDGIRASVLGGKLLTRTLKEVPNRHVFKMFSMPMFNGLDGELIVGRAYDKDVYRATVSGVMTRDGEPDFTYWVFDLHDLPASPYHERMEQLVSAHDDTHANIEVLPQEEIRRLDDLLAYEERQLDLGYEGLILRDASALYKFGRSTAREGALLKLKRFVDSEALVLGVEEEMHNANEAKTNALGRTERSSHKANKIGKGRMGRLRVRDIHTGVEFHIGTGFTDGDKEWFWMRAAGLVGRIIIKYKYFPIGVKDLPRHPVYLGLRDKRDL